MPDRLNYIISLLLDPVYWAVLFALIVLFGSFFAYDYLLYTRIFIPLVGRQDEKADLRKGEISFFNYGGDRALFLSSISALILAIVTTGIYGKMISFLF